VIAADLVSRACLREGISKGRRQPLVLHAEHGKAMRATRLESRLEELGILRSSSRRRISTDDQNSGWILRTQSTGLITRVGHLPARKRPANGSSHLWTFTTTGTDTAISSSGQPNSVTVHRTWRSAVTALSTKNRPVLNTYADRQVDEVMVPTGSGLNQPTST